MCSPQAFPVVFESVCPRVAVTVFSHSSYKMYVLPPFSRCLLSRRPPCPSTCPAARRKTPRTSFYTRLAGRPAGRPAGESGLWAAARAGTFRCSALFLHVSLLRFAIGRPDHGGEILARPGGMNQVGGPSGRTRRCSPLGRPEFIASCLPSFSDFSLGRNAMTTHCLAILPFQISRSFFLSLRCAVGRPRPIH